jgi:hypothetical protein
VAGVAALTLVAGGALAGCGGDGGTGTVAVPSFTATAAGRAQCPGLLGDLPDTVAGQARRTTSGSRYAAAWGDPAIVLRCGLARPRDATDSAPCLTRNGLGWTVPPAQLDDLGADVDLTLAHRTVYVRVHVPAKYRPNGPGEVMADLDAAVRGHTRATGRCR